jgi:ketopantoate reductase
MKTLIVGAGALGGIIGASLVVEGASVSISNRNDMAEEEIKASVLQCPSKLVAEYSARTSRTAWRNFTTLAAHP